MSDNYQNPKGRAVCIILLKAFCLFHTNVEQGRRFYNLDQGYKKQII